MHNNVFFFLYSELLLLNLTSSNKTVEYRMSRQMVWCKIYCYAKLIQCKTLNSN